MKIIISPAKAMISRTDTVPWCDFPVYLDKSHEILTTLKSMDYDALKELWKCNDELAKLNFQRVSRMELDRELCPAIFAYDGIQYQNMDPHTFDALDFEYIQENLRILSGFYGVLRPFDGVRPYRLEMQAKLQINDAKDLYSYWGDCIAKNIMDNCACIINLASKEYSRCVTRFIPKDYPFITCLFGEEKNGKLIEKGTMCKIARGEMLRWMTKNKVERAEQLSDFEGTYHRFSPEFSGKNTYAFIKK